MKAFSSMVLVGWVVLVSACTSCSTVPVASCDCEKTGLKDLSVEPDGRLQMKPPVTFSCANEGEQIYCEGSQDRKMVTCVCVLPQSKP